MDSRLLAILLLLVATAVMSAFAEPIPIAFDVRDAYPHCTPPVLDQGLCGSCYAFAAATAYSVSACMQNVTTGIEQMSPQYLLNLKQKASGGSTPVGCTGGNTVDILTLAFNATTDPLTCTSGGEYGAAAACDGGCMQYAEHACASGCANVQSTVGSCQPFWGTATFGGKCCCNLLTLTTACEGDTDTTSGLASLPRGRPVHVQSPDVIEGIVASDVQAWIANYGPVAAAVYACNDMFVYANTYDVHDEAREIFSGTCAGTPNHAVTIIGWDVEDGTEREYWIVQSSWGTNVSDSGIMYFYVDAQNNGTAGDASLADVTGVCFDTTDACAAAVDRVMALGSSGHRISGLPDGSPAVEDVLTLLSTEPTLLKYDSTMYQAVGGGALISTTAYSSANGTTYYYDVYYNGVNATLVQTRTTRSTSLTTGAIVGIIIGGCMAFVLLLVVVALILRARKLGAAGYAALPTSSAKV